MKEIKQYDSSRNANRPAGILSATTRLGCELSAALLADDGEGSFAGERGHGLVISPASITLALALLAGGVKDEQRQKDFYARLGAGSAEELQSALSWLLELFRNEKESIITGGSAFYSDRSFNMSPTYLRHLDLFHATFNGQHEKLIDAVEEINAWVCTQTRGMIPKLVDELMLKAAHIVILNALSFKGTWETQFDAKNTLEKHPFTLGNGQKCTVPMMMRYSAAVRSFKGKGYTAACLPYKSTPSSSSSTFFVGYLPDIGSTVRNVLECLPDSSGKLRETTYSRFGLPRFEIETSQALLSLLHKLEYPVLGDFSGMGGPGPNLVAEVWHKAKIKVDEEGTRAAAATAIGMTRGGGPPKKRPDLIFDRPFVFQIVNNVGLVLFAGVFSP